MMRKFFLAILMALPLMAAAQDNTWERIEQEPEEVQAATSKYLVKDAVPVVDGMVCWTKTISAPGKSAQQIYDILHKQLEKMIKEPNQIEGSAIIVDDTEKHEMGAVFHEWLVFKSGAFVLDQTKFNFVIEVKCFEEKAEVSISRITYDYEVGRKKDHYTAEKWITDEYAVNKKHTKLNIIFMIGAVVGVILYLSKNEERHNLGLYIILIAMCFKIAESSMRMIK